MSEAKKYGLALILGVILLVIGLFLIPRDVQSVPEDTTAAAVETTAVPTEPPVIYETQTVYLCVKEVMEQWDGSGTSERVHTYDEYGNRIQSESTTYGSGTRYAYDEWGNLLLAQNYSSEGTLAGRTEYTYDDTGILINRRYFSADGSLFSDRTYIYDESGRLVQETLDYTDESLLYDYVYTESGLQCTVNIYRDGEFDGYTDEDYDESGKLLESHSYGPSGEWTYSMLCEYDEQGRIVVEHNYHSSDLQADYDVIYTYDENGLLIFKNVDYYYGYGMEYVYEQFEILVRVN